MSEYYIRDTATAVAVDLLLSVGTVQIYNEHVCAFLGKELGNTLAETWIP